MSERLIGIVLIGIPPSLSVSKVVQFLTGKSFHKTLMGFPKLKKGYCSSVGESFEWYCDRLSQVWKKYIDYQEPNDH